jgi:hypothetical protein
MKKGEKMRQAKKINLAIAWYKPEQWPRLKEISADGDKLEATYGEWQIYAEKVMKDFAAHGVFPVKMEVDTEELLAWCNKRELPVNSENRSFYASWLLKEKDKRKK